MKTFKTKKEKMSEKELEASAKRERTMVELRKIGGVGNDNLRIGQAACQRISHKL